uniref:Uncharacterized protein n=1 Tax=Anguilla anguilla TaxID=7936 RepID=A0A0E9W8Y9_ANGAN
MKWKCYVAFHEAPELVQPGSFLPHPATKYSERTNVQLWEKYYLHCFFIFLHAFNFLVCPANWSFCSHPFPKICF